MLADSLMVTCWPSPTDREGSSDLDLGCFKQQKLEVVLHLHVFLAVCSRRWGGRYCLKGLLALPLLALVYEASGSGDCLT